MSPTTEVPRAVILSEAKNLSRQDDGAAERKLGTPLIRLRTVTSTMETVRHLAALGAAEGTTVIAATQTQGRGRAGRSWQSPPGAGLYCSILLRPDIEAPKFVPFSIAAGLAIANALDPDHTLGIELKWPNDLIAGGRKLAGLLVAASTTGTTVDTAIIGIGLNLRPTFERPVTAISLAEIEAISPGVVQDPLPAVAVALADAYRQTLASDPAVALAGWPFRLAYVNQLVSLVDAGQVWTGVLRGIDPSGAILLETESGIHLFHAGELTRGPVPLPDS